MLTDLLVNPNAYNLSYGGPSKGITYLPNQRNFHLTDRVSWQNSSPSSDTEASLLTSNENPLEGEHTFDELQALTDPVFRGRNDHGGQEFVDGFLRGGLKTNLNRRKLDVVRISKFLYSSPQGGQFLLRQGILQLLNPQENTRTFNAGVSLLAQIGAGSEMRFKRHGLLPETVDPNLQYNANIGRKLGDSLGGKFGDFVENMMGGDYLAIKDDTIRETNYGLGDPAKAAAPDLKSASGIADFVLGDANPFKKKNPLGYAVPVPRGKLDLVNFTSIFMNSPDVNIQVGDHINNAPPGKTPSEVYTKDFCNFQFEVVNSDNVQYSKTIAFRAFLNNFSDSFSANHNQVKMNGRGELFYTYNSFNRKIAISFKIAAQSRDEMKPLYQKLNYLVAQTAPNYSAKGRIRTPYVKLTMGDYFRRVPGILNNVNVTWSKEYPWEIKLDEFGLDRDMKVLPQILDCTVNFTPIHNFVPDNEVDTPFISLDSNTDPDSPDWLPYNEKPISESTRSEDQKKNDDNNGKGTGVCGEDFIASGYYVSSIAKKHGYTTEELLEFNNIADASKLQAGHKINLPCKE
tara:strand:- start:5988 stop:7703 length:1716 start_codon:yes stop_codon:yes gene_type:complete